MASYAGTPIDFRAVFAAAPTPYVVVDLGLAIVEVNRAFLGAVGRRREELVGRLLFDAFPRNPADPDGDGVERLRASLERARDLRRPDTMAVQRYDVEDPASGEFVARWWSAMNIPILDEHGAMQFVLHRTAEVTDYVLEQTARREDAARRELYERRVAEVEADLVERARELQEANEQLRRAGEREREVALTLQRAMLPSPALELDGLEVAVRYRPAEDALQVGGDWFDVVQLADDAVALAVGDVVGKGLRAAAVMGQLRSALSAATHGADGPPEALDTLDRYARTVEGAPGSTVVQVRLDRGRSSIRHARAGHLPALVVTAEGEARFLEDGAGVPLAAFVDATPHPKAEDPFPPGATLVLYTDGLVEQRGRPIDEGLAALVGAVRRHLALDVERLADALLDDLAPAAGAADDRALVVARSTTGR